MTARAPRSDDRKPRNTAARRGDQGRTKGPTAGRAGSGAADTPSGRRPRNRPDGPSGRPTAGATDTTPDPHTGPNTDPNTDPNIEPRAEPLERPAAKKSSPKKAVAKKATPKKAPPEKAPPEKTAAKKAVPAKTPRVTAQKQNRGLRQDQDQGQGQGQDQGQGPKHGQQQRLKQLPKPPAPRAARSSEEYEVSETPVPPLPESPTEAFDQLYELHARALTRQAFLLCGHRRVAERAVGWAFHRAWEHWPEVAVDSDPAGWVRAATYEYALSPWHQFLPGRRFPEAYAGPPEDRALLDALLRLPRTYRAALLLYDGLGLTLPDAAAETEASTLATAARVTHARAALARSWTELRETPDEERRPLLAERLRELASAQPVRTTPPHLVRRGSEHTTRRWTRASIGLTATVTAATVFTLLTAESPSPPPPDKPRSRPSAPPAPSASGLVPEKARPTAPTDPAAPPAGRSGQALPGPGDPAAATPTHAYLPQLRSTNARMHLKEFKDAEGFKDRTDNENSRGNGGIEEKRGSENSGGNGARER